MLRKSQNQREQYDPFREFANDSSDEELSDIKEELQDEENSDDDKSEKSTATEKVFVQSIAYQGNQFGDGQRESKRARLETSEVPFDYTEELYEFGKYVAEQLMCLGVEDARIVQEEIKAVLSKNLNKMSCLEEPSTSYLKPTTDELSTTVTQLVTQEKPVVSVKSSSQKNTAGPSVTLVKTVTKGSKVTSAGSKVNSAGSKVNSAGSNVIQSGSQVNIAEPSLTQSGPSLASKLTKYAVLNVNSGESSISSFGYIVVPNTGALGAQSESGVSFGCPSLTEPRSSGPLFGTPVKVELEHQSSPSHVNVFMSSDTDTELLIVKSEADSEDET